MTLTPSLIGDNAQVPGIKAQVYVPDQLIVDAKNLVSQPIVLGGGNLKRGTILGQQSPNPIAAEPGANTGNGTISALNVTAGALQGNYSVIATAPTTFAVTDPNGVSLGNATVGTAFTGGNIGFLLTAGSTAFVAGDSFTVTVSDAIGTYVACVKTASDGSQNPTAILADDVDASAAPQTAGAYLAGEFNINAVTADASWTLPQIQASLRTIGIFLKPVVSAAPPTNNSAP